MQQVLLSALGQEKGKFQSQLPLSLSYHIKKFHISRSIWLIVCVCNTKIIGITKCTFSIEVISECIVMYSVVLLIEINMITKMRRDIIFEVI